MTKIESHTVEINEIICYKLEDLYSVLRKIEDTPPETDIEMSLDVEIPGVGRRKLRLFDEVALHIKWIVEAE